MVDPLAQPIENLYLIILLLRSNSSLIFLMSNEFRANRNPLKKPHRAAKSLSHGRPAGGRPPMRGLTTFRPSTGGQVTGEVGGDDAAQVIESGSQGLPKPVKYPGLE
jgi:hypothetical protein